MMPVDAGPAGPFGDWLVRLFDTGLFLPVAVLAAAAVGALHALAPGHGKSLTAAYLVGAHGRARDAVRLGTAVAIAHTTSVVAIGALWYAVAGSTSMAMAAVTTWLQLLAGVVVLVVGGVLLRQRWSQRDDAHGHHHHHPSEESSHALVALAVSSGLVPSPSAFLVLVTGLLSGRAASAAALVAAFGVGLASTITLVGIATVKARDLLPLHLGALRRAARYAPVLAASGVVAGGAALAASAVADLI